mmetsp:Transcript_28133/g.68514  ORF Transcript_28133/g.68514 Transcript_28133/m.68514 type:complete len:372 (-) Transcript_28133:121-1236(-)
MRHDGTSRNDGFSSTQVFTKCPRAFNSVHQLDGISLDVKPQHAAVQIVPMLAVGQFLLRKRVQTGIDTLGNFGMIFQKGGNFHGRCRLLTDAESHGLHGLQNQVGSHGTHNVPMHILNQLDAFVKFGSLGNQGTTGTNVETIIILGEGLNGQIRTVIQRTGNIRSSKGRITNVQDSMLLGNGRNGIQISQSQSGIRGSFTKDKFGVWLDGIFDSLRIGKVDKGKFHSKGFKLFSTDTVGSTITTVGNDTVISCRHESIDTRSSSGHACSHNDTVVTILNFGHFFFQHFDSGIVGATVRIASVQVFVDRFLDKGCTEVNRSQDGSSLFTGSDTAMNNVCIHRNILYPRFVQWVLFFCCSSRERAYSGRDSRS